MIKIALAQMDVKQGDPETNRETVRQMVVQADAADADLVVLPELWGSGYDLVRARRYASSLRAGLFDEMAALARAHDLYLAGSLLERDDDRVYNTCALFGPQGLEGHYRKLHLFGLMNEDRYLAPGDRPVLCEGLPWGVTALAICYDLRFPELFRGYAIAGARLVLLPAQWPTRRIEHWRALLRARAIENQCVVAGCNRVGVDPDGALFGGASAVVGPWGERLVEGGDDSTLLIAKVDFAKVDQARRFIPTMRDRRPECYGTLSVVKG